MVIIQVAFTTKNNSPPLPDNMNPIQPMFFCIFNSFLFSLTEEEDLLFEHFSFLRYENIDFTQNEIFEFEGNKFSVFANTKFASFYTKYKENSIFSKSKISFDGNTLTLNTEFLIDKNGVRTQFRKNLRFLLVQGKYLIYQHDQIYVAPVELKKKINFIVRIVESSSIYNYNPDSRCCICELICRILKSLF